MIYAASCREMFWYNSMGPLFIPFRLLMCRSCFESLPSLHLCCHSSLHLRDMIMFLADFIVEVGSMVQNIIDE